MIKNIESFPAEIQTIPVSPNKIGVWFSVCTEKSKIFISPAKHNSPASRIKPDTSIPRNDFERLLPIYHRRQKGEKVSEEAKRLTRFQVYIYSILQKYGDFK